MNLGNGKIFFILQDVWHNCSDIYKNSAYISAFVNAPLLMCLSHDHKQCSYRKKNELFKTESIYINPTW